MSLARVSEVTERLNADGGPIAVFPIRSGYAKQLWKHCDCNVRTLWNKLDAGKREKFVHEYFGPDAADDFYDTMRFLDWIYSKLNKSTFDSECAIHIASPQKADEIWAEYSHDRSFDGLWLCRSALPGEAVQALRELVPRDY